MVINIPTDDFNVMFSPRKKKSVVRKITQKFYSLIRCKELHHTKPAIRGQMTKALLGLDPVSHNGQKQMPKKVH